MTRRRSYAPGCVRPDRRRSILNRFALLIGVAIIAVGCATGSDDGATPTVAASIDPGPTTATPTASAPSVEVSPTPTPVEPEVSGPAPTDPPPTTSPTDGPASTGGPGSAAECAGSDENRDFFEAVAAGVDWAVFCPVLGSGWFVDAGQYRLAGGGQMTISYTGPSGSGLELRQGRVCADAACDWSGTDLGPAAYGELTGTMLDIGGGRYAVLVEPDAARSWTLVTSGLSEAEARTVSADLVRVSG